MPRKPPPAGWPRMTNGITYRNAAAAIDWLCAAFGFTIRIRVEDDAGNVIHAELEYGDGLVMIGQEGAKDNPAQPWRALMRSPASIGGVNTQTIMVYVDDAEAHCATARAHGAAIVTEPVVQDYGPEYWADRSYGARDCEGHMWWIAERLVTRGQA